MAAIERSTVAVKIKPKRKARPRAALGIGVALLILLLLWLLTSGVVLERRQNVSTRAVVPVVVAEPFNITEEYEEAMPLGPKVCAMRPMNHTVSVLPMRFGENNSVICEIELTNHEEVAGSWTYDAWLQTDLKRHYAPEQTKEVPGKTTVSFSWSIPFDPGVSALGCEFFVQAQPSTQKCFYPEPVTYKMVKRSRTVTVWRNVTRYQEVELVNETTSNRTVSRFFGYELPFYIGW